MGKFVDMTGKKFGKWVVLSRSHGTGAVAQNDSGEWEAV